MFGRIRIVIGLLVPHCANPVAKVAPVIINKTIINIYYNLLLKR